MAAKLGSGHNRWSKIKHDKAKEDVRTKTGLELALDSGPLIPSNLKVGDRALHHECQGCTIELFNIGHRHL